MVGDEGSIPLSQHECPGTRCERANFTCGSKVIVHEQHKFLEGYFSSAGIVVQWAGSWAIGDQCYTSLVHALKTDEHTLTLGSFRFEMGREKQ